MTLSSLLNVINLGNGRVGILTQSDFRDHFLYQHFTQIFSLLLFVCWFLFQSLVREDPLEKEVATGSSILVWESPWTEEPGGLQSMLLQRVRHILEIEQQHNST